MNAIRVTEAPVTELPHKKKKPRKTGRLKISKAVRTRFEGYLDRRKSKCWAWNGSRTSDGYGQFWINDYKVVKAHRFAYEIFIRKLSKNERLHNICKGKACINPSCWQVHKTGAAGKRSRKQ